MRIIKKIISLIIIAAIIATSYIFPSASENIIIHSDSITAVAGETINVPIEISNNTGFMGFSIIVEFDDTVFTPVSVKSGDMLSKGSLSDSIGGTMQSNIVKVVYTDSSNVTANGELFSVNFNVSESAAGDYEFKISYLPKDTFDENFDNVSFYCENVSIFIENENVENAVKIGGGSFSVNAGETLTVPISVSNAVNMNVVDLDITYNQKVLELVGYNVGEILKIGKIDVSENQSQISFACQNLSISRDGNFLYLKFKVAEYIEKKEEILISCKSISVADGSPKQAVCCNPLITIKNPYAGKSTFICSDSGVFIIDNHIDIPVYINNNHGVMGFGIDIDYDSTILEPVSVTKGEVLGAGNFEDNIGNISDKIKIRWNNSANISENGLLVTLRFNILNAENLNAIPITFTYSQPDTYNEKWEDVELDIKIGTIIVKREHTIRFVADGKVVSTQKFITGMTASELVMPGVPPKSGYNGRWEAFSLGDKDIDVNCIYTPIVYTATFMDADGKVIGTDEFTLSDAALDYPQTDELEGYAWSWSKHEITAENITVTGKYVPIEYTATFVADGVIVATQAFTVETKKLDEPPVPQKAGCYAYWGAYEIAAHDITIEAQYKSPEVFMIAKRTLYVGETYRLLPSCNFTMTEKSWRTNDASVATVDQSGVVTAVGEGECIITVTCYGVDSLGNAVHASKSTEIIVKGDGENGPPSTFRELFDEFFEVTLHDILYNFKEFIILLLRYAY